MTYSGVRCPVCSKKFGGSDDIVVCPVCGAPHHRECWFVKCECAFASKHMSGRAWQPYPDYAEQAAADGASEQACADCGKTSPAENLFCNHCGNRLDGEKHGGPAGYVGSLPFSFAGPRRPYEDENEALGELTVAEYASYVGQGAYHYLPGFKLIGRGERLVSLNIWALLLGFLYYFYRKMYLVGSVLLLLFIIGMIPFVLWSKEALPLLAAESAYMRETLRAIGVAVSAADMNYGLLTHYENLMSIAWTINFLIAGFTSFLANRLYYAQASRAIYRLRAEHSIPENPGRISDYQEYKAALRKAGGCNLVIAVVLVTGLYSTLNFSLVSYWGL